MEEALIADVVRIRDAGAACTARDVHAALEREGRVVTLSEVKKASSKAAKRCNPAAHGQSDVATASTLPTQKLVTPPTHQEQPPNGEPMDAFQEELDAKLASMGCSDQAQTRQASDAAYKKQTQQNQKELRAARREGATIIHLSGTAFGLVGPGLPLPDGVPSNFALKQEAQRHFQQGTGNGGLGNFRGERYYREYYDDLVADRAAWLTFFDHGENYEHAEHTCGVLGTLATVYRQRGTLDECERVLDMEREVLTRYERASVGACSAQVRCCEGLGFKYRVIRFNMCSQMRRFRECAPLAPACTHSLRTACAPPVCRLCTACALPVHCLRLLPCVQVRAALPHTRRVRGGPQLHVRRVAVPIHAVGGAGQGADARRAGPSDRCAGRSDGRGAAQVSRHRE